MRRFWAWHSFYRPVPRPWPPRHRLRPNRHSRRLPSRSAAPSPAVEPTPRSTNQQTPKATARALTVDGVAVTEVDDLRVRSKPRVADDSLKHKPLLPRGTPMYVLDGPVSASGYTWYEVAPLALANASPGLGCRWQPRRRTVAGTRRIRLSPGADRLPIPRGATTGRRPRVLPAHADHRRRPSDLVRVRCRRRMADAGLVLLGEWRDARRARGDSAAGRRYRMVLAEP